MTFQPTEASIALIASSNSIVSMRAGVVATEFLGKRESEQALVDQGVDTVARQPAEVLRPVAAVDDHVAQLLDALQRRAGRGDIAVGLVGQCHARRPPGLGSTARYFAVRAPTGVGGAAGARRADAPVGIGDGHPPTLVGCSTM